ncbi:S9 family peptidase [Massilia eurypsychrophila]|uniref:Acyl-peptide hydrolase n=1 Tax=Massilia eurypsychrophila TaxID=1485217 RepID=A0A2G8T973_9BURK|nr:S9 family peptidase [Massilia eurypsychrophila]PIL42552.1 S9 family peptidase [Massilia eurypsychrophila]
MRFIGTLVRLSAFAAMLQPAFAAPVKEVSKTPKRYTIERFMATTSISGASFSRDEKQILFSSNESGIFNAYTIPVAGGKPVAMTKSTTDSTYAVSFFYNDDRILFTRDSGGNENNHLFVRELDGAEKDLTPGDKHKASFAGWRPDGNAFYVTTNERDPRFFDLYRYDAKTYARTMLYKNESGMNVSTISRDEQWLALQKTTTTSDSDIYLFNLATGESKHITPHTTPASYGAATFDPQSRRLFFTTNASGEFAAIRTYDIASGATAEREKADWDLLGTSYSRDGRFRTSVVNQDGSIAVRVVEGPAEKAVALPKLPGGEMRQTTFSPSSRLMAFYVNGDRSPNNLYVHDFQTRQTRQLTSSLNKEIDPADLVEAEVVRFTSFDGTVIPSIYYRPKNASPTNKVPALVWVHGGPGGQTTRGYSAQIQYLVNHGYAVLGINNRGSSGYGKTFFTADDRKHGREPLWDCVEAKTFLASLGNIDPQRIGIVGGSYGGYMVLSAMAFRPEAFKVGIDIFGVSNWIRTLESIPAYWETQRKALYDEIGDPVADRAMLMATSPLFHAKEIRRPLMVIQGANDPRVIKPESDEIVDAVKKNNVPVEYIVFADEGHGFSKKKNQAEASARMLAFLDKYLKP